MKMVRFMLYMTERQRFIWLDMEQRMILSTSGALYEKNTEII